MSVKDKVDYNEEAMQLFEMLKIDPPVGGYLPLNVIYRHPETNFCVYVGDKTAAKSKDILDKHRIRAVVNCTDDIPNYYEANKLESSISYFRFNIVDWTSYKGDEELLRFITPMISFINNALKNNVNVLIHCFAGAHRAGTTGCLVMMHLLDYASVSDIIKWAKLLRPWIDPFGELKLLLIRYDRAIRRNKGFSFASSFYEKLLEYSEWIDYGL